MTTTEDVRGRRKSAVGVVTSNKMQKTISVRVARLVKHATYGKYMRRHTICKAHDEKQEASIGDTVRIVETRPLSKTKRWRLLEIVARGRASEPEVKAAAAAPAR